MKQTPSLLLCVLMDLFGYATYMLPVIGEWGDIVWAPISAFVFYKSFGGKTGTIGAFINFAEEIIPFTDFIPTFCLGYLYQQTKRKK